MVLNFTMVFFIPRCWIVVNHGIIWINMVLNENSHASHPGNADLSLSYWRNPRDIEVHPIDPIAILLSSPVIQFASRNDGNTTRLLPVLMRKSSRSGYFYDVSSMFLRDLIWLMMHQPSYKSKSSFCGQLQLLPICHPSGSKGQFRRPAGKRRCASWGLDHRIGSWSLTPQWLKCRAAWTPKSLVLGGALLNMFPFNQFKQLPHEAPTKKWVKTKRYWQIRGATKLLVQHRVSFGKVWGFRLEIGNTSGIARDLDIYNNSQSWIRRFRDT